MLIQFLLQNQYHRKIETCSAIVVTWEILKPRVSGETPPRRRLRAWKERGRERGEKEGKEGGREEEGREPENKKENASERTDAILQRGGVKLNPSAASTQKMHEFDDDGLCRKFSTHSIFLLRHRDKSSSCKFVLSSHISGRAPRACASSCVWPFLPSFLPRSADNAGERDRERDGWPVPSSFVRDAEKSAIESNEVCIVGRRATAAV